LTGADGLLKQLTKTVLETALNEEMTKHFGLWQLCVVTVVIGAGIGFAYGSMPALIMSAVPCRRQRRPTASTPWSGRWVAPSPALSPEPSSPPPLP
jgi:MFS family permease